MCPYCRTFNSCPEVIAEHIAKEHPDKDVVIITDECVGEHCGHYSVKPSIKQMRGIAEVLRKHYER